MKLQNKNEKKVAEPLRFRHLFYFTILSFAHFITTLSFQLELVPAR